MIASPLSIAGAYLLESPVFGDERGLFREWFKESELPEELAGFTVRQANLSRSARDVVRGLHYSLAPEGQAKAVTCVDGALDDVLVDVRVGSPTFGLIEYLSLSADEGLTVLIPSGVAHGFCVRTEWASMAYLLSSPYNPSLELEIHPLDESLSVPWQLVGPAILSAKDAAAPSLEQRRASGELPIYV